ncbi:uncharacterized protein [Nicotiana tomentosiformis]|uniref:uncharacterized protein n=1 Tax=Nicotiana tomentosiformis TaxID=4098 RepID=UPI00388C49D5
MEMINMDFVVGLHRNPRKFDSFWVIGDRLIKSAHFLPVKATDTAEQYAQLYVKEIVRLHGTPVSIISVRGAQFTAKFWKIFQQGLDTQVNLSTTFNPQIDGQAKRTIKTREDMLRSCVLDFKELIGPDLVHQAMEKVKVINDRLKTAQSRYKSYSGVCHRDLEFQEDDWVFLKVSPMKDLMQFGGWRSVSSIEVNEELTYEEIPVAIIYRQVQKLRNKEIASVKVLWRNHQVEEAT